MALDRTDRKILDILQHDAARPAADIAAAVGLTVTPCWRRIQKLEKGGFIRGRVALLDAEKLNVAVTVFVAVRTSRHTNDWLEQFKRAIRDIPEIVEAHRMGGDIDYLLRVVVPNIEGYDRIYKRLIDAVEFSDVSSNFSMETLKSTTALPLDHA
jgi:Lrp/AsnC family transcriptional regulator